MNDAKRMFGFIGNSDPELITRANKDTSHTNEYKEKKRIIRNVKYFFVAVACLLLLFVIAKCLG